MDDHRYFTSMGTFIPTIAVNRRRFEVNEVNEYGATGLKISAWLALMTLSGSHVGTANPRLLAVDAMNDKVQITAQTVCRKSYELL